MILTEIGEIGVYAPDGLVRLRPSLYAMCRLGDPAEIVSAFTTVMGSADGDAQIERMFQISLGVIYACAEDDADLSGLFGTYESDDGAGMRYVPGLAPKEHVIPLARCLLKHGITGALAPLPQRSGDEPEYIKEFSARDNVAAAMAHLGVSEQDAWRMTMTGLVGALRSKFPQAESNAPGAKAPTKEQHDATMAWFDKIEAKRKAAKGIH